MPAVVVEVADGDRRDVCRVGEPGRGGGLFEARGTAVGAAIPIHIKEWAAASEQEQVEAVVTIGIQRHHCRAKRGFEPGECGIGSGRRFGRYRLRRADRRRWTKLRQHRCCQPARCLGSIRLRSVGRCDHLAIPAHLGVADPQRLIPLHVEQRLLVGEQLLRPRGITAAEVHRQTVHRGGEVGVQPAGLLEAAGGLVGAGRQRHAEVIPAGGVVWVDLCDGLEVRLCDVEFVAVQCDDPLAEVRVGIVRVVAEDGGQFVAGFVKVWIGGRVEQGDCMVDPGGEPLGGGLERAGELPRCRVEVELLHQADAAVGGLHGSLGD